MQTPHLLGAVQVEAVPACCTSLVGVLHQPQDRPPNRPPPPAPGITASPSSQTKHSTSGAYLTHPETPSAPSPLGCISWCHCLLPLPEGTHTNSSFY